MADHIRYDLLTQQALRSVVRNVLTDVAKKKVLPGEHHFYISFDTQADGARLSQRLREQYPEEMTIILQHQFWDLTVTEDAFEVGLSFGGIPERLTVPFAAINGFFDPSVQFGLQFEQVGEGQDNAAPAPAAAKKPGAAKKRATLQRNSPAAPSATTAGADPKDAGKDAAKETAKEAKTAKPAGGAEVVRLDRFRKK